MTDAEIIAYVHSEIGGERKTGLVKPVLLALVSLTYGDLADYLITSDPDKAKKLITEATNQVWASSSFSAPANMLFTNEKSIIRLDLGGTLCFQVKDRDKLDMTATLSIMNNSYYALEGKTFYIKERTGLTGGSNLNIRYYKIPINTDIDSELRKPFLELLMQRIAVYMGTHQQEISER